MILRSIKSLNFLFLVLLPFSSSDGLDDFGETARSGLDFFSLVLCDALVVVEPDSFKSSSNNFISSSSFSCLVSFLAPSVGDDLGIAVNNFGIIRRSTSLDASNNWARIKSEISSESFDFVLLSGLFELDFVGVDLLDGDFDEDFFSSDRFFFGDLDSSPDFLRSFSSEREDLRLDFSLLLELDLDFSSRPLLFDSLSFLCSRLLSLSLSFLGSLETGSLDC